MSLTTGNDGSFTGNISNLTAGSHTLDIIFEEDNDYHGSTVTRHITGNAIILEVTADNPVIQSGETSTITAYLHDSNPIPNESVTFTVKHGATIIDTDTGTTDSNGECTYTYTGTAVGDVEILVECMLLQETYELLDVKLYIPNSQIGSETGDYRRYNNDRYLWVSNYTLDVGDTILFKINDVGNSLTLGIFNWVNSSDAVFDKKGSRYKLYRDGYNESNFSSRWSNGTVFELRIVQEGSAVHIQEYCDGEYKDWWNTQFDARNIRADNYDDNPFDVDIIVL